MTFPSLPKIGWILLCMVLAYLAFVVAIRIAKIDPIPAPPAEVTKP